MKRNILDVDNNLGKAKFFEYRLYIEIKVIIILIGLYSKCIMTLLYLELLT